MLLPLEDGAAAGFAQRCFDIDRFIQRAGLAGEETRKFVVADKAPFRHDVATEPMGEESSAEKSGGKNAGIAGAALAASGEPPAIPGSRSGTGLRLFS